MSDDYSGRYDMTSLMLKPSQRRALDELRERTGQSYASLLLTGLVLVGERYGVEVEPPQDRRRKRVRHPCRAPD